MTITFNKAIYPLKAIKIAIQSYKGLGKFKLTEKNRYFVVRLTNIKKGVEKIIKDEFCNYVLSQVKQ